ncbi:hypothetical protein MAPG_10132 [Magnaporthiopsis poae ATCC 64411]|uniref:Uncharacterized protein n=1 Tax=Magnaporthiopsis poae (strain ATCC 64411 / 73-15) TaxID=644358 RepID=A0A0C4EBS6_MAGP6|nr:hypothetical protein MAPG_10132 [Magnaporthiopsis poae ATCC 64411]
MSYSQPSHCHLSASSFGHVRLFRKCFSRQRHPDSILTSAAQAWAASPPRLSESHQDAHRQRRHTNKGHSRTEQPQRRARTGHCKPTTHPIAPYRGLVSVFFFPTFFPSPFPPDVPPVPPDLHVRLPAEQPQQPSGITHPPSPWCRSLRQPSSPRSCAPRYMREHPGVTPEASDLAKPAPRR